MNKSSIEYLTHTWNFYTGCRHQETGVCTLPCWAKAMAKRFGRSFEPEFHTKTFAQPFPAKAARIGVCFTGDLFGDWVDPADHCLASSVFLRVRAEPWHQFFFLTKAPWNLHKWGQFPDNAWVGVSVTNQRQHNEAVAILSSVEAKHKWISYEPLLSPINFHAPYNLKGISWVVIGAQTHPMVMPGMDWVRKILVEAGLRNIPVWVKNNILNHPDNDLRLLEMRQELPL